MNCSRSRAALAPNSRTSARGGGAAQSGCGSPGWEYLSWLGVPVQRVQANLAVQRRHRTHVQVGPGQFRRCQRLLRDELGVEPSESMRRLLEELPELIVRPREGSPGEASPSVRDEKRVYAGLNGP